ncbi:MAG: hypothetical protein KDI09_16100, partial [Halioglobus sp.]|nr:hypothetical protein [Halioglobus sp.]
MINSGTVIGLIAAGLILTGCATPAVPSADAPSPAADARPSGSSLPALSSRTPVAPPAPPAKPDIRRLSIAMVGDMMLGTNYPEDRLPDDDGLSFLAAVAPLLQSADI